MARSDDHPNPFGWVILGFLCGVIATVGALILLSRGPSNDGPDEEETTAADSTFGSRATPTPAPSATPPAVMAPAPQSPPVAAPDSPAPAPALAAPSPRPTPPSDLDPQIADDAAASGMTAHSTRP